jgi:hypothetical protein
MMEVLQKTCQRRTPLVERFIKIQGLHVMRYYVEKCYDDEEEDLLDMVLQTIRVLPVMMDFIKESRLARSIKKLQDDVRESTKLIMQEVGPSRDGCSHCAHRRYVMHGLDDISAQCMRWRCRFA